VVTLAVCLFITTWRTIIPVRLGSPELGDRVPALHRRVLLSVAVGYGGGIESPFIFCGDDRDGRRRVRVGHLAGLVALLAGSVSMAVGTLVPGQLVPDAAVERPARPDHRC
jgi:hypothetical protein